MLLDHTCVVNHVMVMMVVYIVWAVPSTRPITSSSNFVLVVLIVLVSIALVALCRLLLVLRLLIYNLLVGLLVVRDWDVVTCITRVLASTAMARFRSVIFPAIAYLAMLLETTCKVIIHFMFFQW